MATRTTTETTDNTTQADDAALRYRAIVRGNDANGTRVRRVRTYLATPGTEGEGAEKHCADMAAEFGGLDAPNVYATVYPPAGVRVDGSVSKGFGVDDKGNLQWVGRAHKAGEPVPTKPAEVATPAAPAAKGKAKAADKQAS